MKKLLLILLSAIAAIAPAAELHKDATFSGTTTIDGSLTFGGTSLGSTIASAKTALGLPAVFVFAGDSRFSQDGVSAITPATQIAQLNWKEKPRYINTAVTGSTAATMDANYASSVAPYRPSVIGSSNSYLLVNSGYNDAVAAVSAATIEGHLQSEWDKARADGFKVIVYTIIHGSDSSANAIVDTVNTWMRGGTAASHYDYLVDVAATFTDSSNELYYHTDHIHLNAYGAYTQAVLSATTLWFLLDKPAFPVLPGSEPIFASLDLLPTDATGTLGVIKLGTKKFLYSPGDPSLGNLFIGPDAGNLSVSGTGDMGMGYQALKSVTSGSSNLAFGPQALTAVTSGGTNIAFGPSAGVNITTGSDTISIGVLAGASITTSTGTISIGNNAFKFGTGNYCNSIGGAALFSTTGTRNQAFGFFAGIDLSSGSDNILIGDRAGSVGTSLTTGSGNIVIGSGLGVPNAAGNGQLTIGNLIFGTGMVYGTTTGTTLSTGKVGIKTNAPVTDLDVFGTFNSSGVATMSNFKRGSGSPEGVVTGIVGDLYTRTDGGANTTLYVKESGTGNTGWVAK